MVNTPQSTKQAILDAAEELFARKGFHATSLRSLTGKAGVNLAAVNYHFGSKEALIEAVIKRRLLPLNEIRAQRLEEVRERAAQAKRPPDPRAALRAFVEPTLAFSRSGPGPGSFTTIIGRALAESDQTVMPVFLQHIQPLYDRLFTTLCEALPEVPRSEVYWRLHFCLGAIIHTMKMVKIPMQAPVEVDCTTNTEELTEMLLNFVAAGMVRKA